jgi:hypothetical protein
MTRYSGEVQPGDVLVTREGPWWVSGAIRLGAWMRGLPSVCNHVIVVHHQDVNGTWWGIEGRPGGVGWRDLSGPLSWPATNANNDQPKTTDQREQICDLLMTMLGRPYDWAGIGADAIHALEWAWKLPTLGEWSDTEVPGQLVCSSLADWAQERAGLASPGGGLMTRYTTPGDWDLFMTSRQWEQ